MATICPRCWNSGVRVEMKRVPSKAKVRVVPTDRFPDGTVIEHEPRLDPSPYGTCVCGTCGYEEKDRIPDGVDIRMSEHESDKR